MQKQLLEFLRGPVPRAVLGGLYFWLADIVATLAVIPLILLIMEGLTRMPASLPAIVVLLGSCVAVIALRFRIRRVLLRHLKAAAGGSLELLLRGPGRLLPYAAAALMLLAVGLIVVHRSPGLGVLTGLLALSCVLLWLAPYVGVTGDRGACSVDPGSEGSSPTYSHPAAGDGEGPSSCAGATEDCDESDGSCD